MNIFDKIILRVDNVLRSKHNINKLPARSNPAAKISTPTALTETERQQSIAMMRINHSGEVCAQALYKGQALMANSAAQYKTLLQSANEETDHLLWCQQRLQDLNGRTSLLNPLWYAGSYAIGAIAGLAGDKISLGFLAETEHQVSQHIENHLQRMSPNDQKSRAVLEQMRFDEQQHATQAQQAGAANLPATIKVLMRFTAQILTITAAKI